ncbi:MAG: hypothetical protein AB8G22_12450 [Saprospiraceae bacterium]
MENQDNNLEDFFNRSLESFNDEPSDLVWEGIDRRLARPIPFYHQKIFWLMNSIWLAIVMGLGWWGTGQQQVATDLQLEKDRLVVDNQDLRVGWLSCQKTEELLSQELELACVLSNLSEKLTTPPSSFIPVISPKNTASTIIIPSLNDSFDNSIPAQETQLIQAGREIKSYEIAPTTLLRKPLINTFSTAISPSILLLPPTDFTNFNDTIAHAGLPSFRWGTVGGLSAAYISVPDRVNWKYQSNSSYSVGAFSEFKVKSKLETYIRVGMNYGVDSYGFITENDPANVINNFPTTDQIREDIGQVEIGREYLELFVGTYSFQRARKKWRFFLGADYGLRYNFQNRYQYFTRGTEAAQRVYGARERVKEFSFLNFTTYVGVEKKISPQLYWQLKFFINDQITFNDEAWLDDNTNIGFRAAISFGKLKSN